MKVAFSLFLMPTTCDTAYVVIHVRLKQKEQKLYAGKTDFFGSYYAPCVLITVLESQKNSTSIKFNSFWSVKYGTVLQRTTVVDVRCIVSHCSV